MNYKELLDKTIELHDLNGRSFTYGVALYTAIKRGRFTFEEEATEQLIEELEQAINSAIGVDISGHFTLDTLAEMIDIAALDDIACELVGLEEGV